MHSDGHFTTIHLKKCILIVKTGYLRIIKRFNDQFSIFRLAGLFLTYEGEVDAVKIAPYTF